MILSSESQALIARPLRVLLAVVLVLLTGLSVLAGSAKAQTVRVQALPLPTRTLTDAQILAGGAESAPSVALGTYLRLPAAAQQKKVPAVVLLHGSGGASGNVDEWAQKMASWGIATLTLDSFSGRGIASTVADQDQLGRLSAAFDAYRALEALARHPAVDADRIAVMGFSRGAQSAVYSAMERLYKLHGPAGGRRFAAHIGLYTNCAVQLKNDTELVDRPLLLLHGSADDYAPAAPCRAYVQRLRSAGKNVVYAEYEAAPHVFDWPLLPPSLRLADAQVTSQCRLSEADAGRIVGADGLPFRHTDPCVTRGATVGYQAQAQTAAVQAVQGFLGQVFGTTR